MEGNGGDNCTSAFVGYDPSNRPGLFTAAHCYAIPEQSLHYRDTDGKLYTLIVDGALTPYTTKEDIMFLRFPSGLTGLPQFYANRNEGARTLSGRRTLSNTNADYSYDFEQAKWVDTTTQGSYICFYGTQTGPTYGQGCGEVKYKEFAATTTGSQGKMRAVSGPSYYVQVHGLTSGMHCVSGDSGSPWFAYTTAFGVMSSCDENALNGNTSVANYTSMDAAYARGYRLAY